MRVTDEQIISALLCNRTNADVAAALNLNEATLYERMKKPEFQLKLSEAKTRLLEGATAAAQGRMSEAVSVMVEIMRGKQNAPQTRLNAADAVLRNGIKLAELVDFEKRLTEIEARILEVEKNER